MNPPPFTYSPEIAERYPDLAAAVVVATGLRNRPTPPERQRRFAAMHQAALAALDGTTAGQLPPIVAWRRAFTSFGVKPTQHRNAAEALLRRLTSTGELPSIDLCVDIGNAISVTHTLPVAVVDLDRIAPPITVRLARGDETFIAVASEEVSRPDPGEVIFTDTADTVVARRWCWRQSAPASTTPATSRAMYIIEAQHAGGGRDVADAASELVALLGELDPAPELQRWSIGGAGV